MTAIVFDTLKYADRLENAGVPREQAKAEAEALADVLGTADQVIRTDLQIELAPLRAELILLKWMVGLSLALTTGLLALLARIAFSLPR
ncbi:MAG TPA: DUF1640 domain-containing protein [Lamprocystis sp. (in: g-proteobacteria)]|nr:DUF1640 domain-containing protein [Lamprocystis sp. (in: g-proteobacteria)]